jgi:hypothetical protein
MTGPDRATVWLRLPSGRCDPVEVDIDPPDTLAALTKWERVTGRTDLWVVTVGPAPPGAGPPNPVLGLPAIAGEPADGLLDHLVDEHGIADTGRFVLHAQGVSGLVKDHDLDHTENCWRTVRRSRMPSCSCCATRPRCYAAKWPGHALTGPTGRCWPGWRGSCLARPGRA